MPIPCVSLLAEGPQPTDYEVDNLRQAAAREPRGVYTVARTYSGLQTVLLDAHFDRLEQSARLEGHPVTLDRGEIRAGLRQVLQMLDGESARFRITVPLSPAGPILVATEPLPPMPEQVKRAGVSVLTFQLKRDNPQAKSNSWEHARSKAMDQMPARAYEGLLLNGDQCIREGFSSNFFAVIDQAVHTAEHGILQGISRRIVLEQLPSDVVVVYQAPHLNRLPDMAEAFLSSSSRGVVPIVSINDETVGSGEPGPTTRDLNERYDAWVQSHLEPI